MPLQATSGAASYDAFGGGVAAVPNYIEECFSTYLYTGNDVALTVTNGIDLSTKGGLVWGKSRSGSQNHRLYDTARGSNFSLISNATSAQSNQGTNACAFNTDGFSLSAASGIVSSATYGGPNYVSWTFRKQPKFFDVVTYTGNGAGNQDVAHNLGSTPGCIIVKKTSATGNWIVYHRGISGGDNIRLNTTDSASAFGSPDPLSLNGAALFSVGAGPTSADNLNDSGATYVAYLFAHNAGGFGLTGTDDVISCGSTTGGVTSLGFEPQWVLVKNTTSTGYWRICDNIRGMPFANSTATNTIDGASLFPNVSDAEDKSTSALKISGNSFFLDTSALGAGTYIYIAIRRGPMKVPTSGTSVFSPITANSPTGTKLTTNFPVDLSITQERATAGGAYWMDRLRGALSPGQTGTTPYLQSSNTGAETLTTITNGWDNTGLNVAYFGNLSAVWWNLRRAPNFFDEVCYTGTAANRTITHNLAAVPEFMIVKIRIGFSYSWFCYHAALGATQWIRLDSANTPTTQSTTWNNTAPTSSVFTVGTANDVNRSGSEFVAYLFASALGVSKVGSYTGNGSSQTINCGFTTGARFVLIRRTDGAGDWYVWDTARGIVAGNDPHLSMNTTAAEVTSNDTIDTASTGFVVNQVAATDVNVNAAAYIFLAIA